MIFGAMMLFSTLRFWWLGWIENHYIESKVQFKYFGFEWVTLLPPVGMYALHIVLIISALGILLGAWYRLSASLFFFAFTYIELIDLTYYLNHYYFVSLISLLLIIVPAHRRFSVDVWRKPDLYSKLTPRWTIFLFQLQLGIVYTYAGLAKINHDWLIAALPLRIWVHANDTLPLIGPLMTWKYTPWVFSWVGMLYDTVIVWLLIWPRTRAVAYISVIIFHAMTGLMFQIGVFPLVMIGATWIFFSPAFHERLLHFLTALASWAIRKQPTPKIVETPPALPATFRPLPVAFVLLFFLFQFLFPWRYLLYPGNIYWTEEGYRFSWRVMLMEKAGTATFYVKDGKTGREGIAYNADFLCAHQEKQMAMQPDMILQYARFLKQYYEKNGMSNPAVRAEVYVTLNGRPSKLLIDPNIDLTTIRDSWSHKTWINADK